MLRTGGRENGGESKGKEIKRRARKTRKGGEMRENTSIGRKKKKEGGNDVCDKGKTDL